MSVLSRGLVLVIDDDRASRLLLSQLLRPDSYRLEFAEDGEAGFELAQQLQPDLILLDVLMPRLDGFEVCRRLRRDPNLAEVPILLLTALEDEESRLTGLESGADDFISKPFHAPELRARVRSVMRLNRYRRIRTIQDRFAWVLDQADDAYLLVDQNGQLLYANLQAHTLLSLTPEVRPGIQALPLIQRQFRLQPPELWEYWPNLPQDRPLHLLRPETEHAAPVWLEVRALAHTLGWQQEIFLQLRDVTGQLSSARSVWSFESLICHKLRTPMTKISWGLSFIANKAERLSVSKIKEFAEMSQTGVDHLKRELEAVLSYLSAPSATPGGEEGYPLDCLEDSLGEIVAQLEMAPVKIERQGPLPPSVQISGRAFEIILWELLQNCKKFHPRRQPQVALRIGPSPLEELKGLVVFYLIDDGLSLSPEQLQRVFMPYYQGEKFFTGQIPGMGLGLSMVRSLLWEVGGDCRLRNRADSQGVEVELHLPGGES